MNLAHRRNDLYLEYHSMIFWIAMIVLNIIAIVAMTVADRELAKALREIDKLSSERSTFLPSSQADAMP